MQEPVYKTSEIKSVFNKWILIYLTPERKEVRSSALRHFWAEFEEMLEKTHSSKNKK